MINETLWNSIHNAYTGTACIIANGPSLNDIPLFFLRKYPTFGTNNIFLKGFVSNYYAVTNLNVIQQSLEQILDYPSELKFSKVNLPGFLQYRIDNGKRFSTNLLVGLHEGHTVTHVCLQIAWWMGYTKILLVGLDHKYNDTGTPNKTVTKDTPDTDHFDPNYFPPGTVWQYPDLLQSETSYKRALQVYKKSGRSIINVSTKSECAVFPREPWQNYA